MNQQEIITFLDLFTQEINKTGIDVSKYNLDHVAFQTSSSEDYEKTKLEFEKLSHLEHEALVSNRRVGVFKLENTIQYKNNIITAIELLEPRSDQICSSHWEHAEFVINEPYKELMTRYPNLNWDVSSMETPIYNHLKLKLNDSMQVKFHLMDILETIKLDIN